MYVYVLNSRHLSLWYNTQRTRTSPMMALNSDRRPDFGPSKTLSRGWENALALSWGKLAFSWTIEDLGVTWEKHGKTFKIQCLVTFNHHFPYWNPEHLGRYTLVYNPLTKKKRGYQWVCGLIWAQMASTRVDMGAVLISSNFWVWIWGPYKTVVFFTETDKVPAMQPIINHQSWRVGIPMMTFQRDLGDGLWVGNSHLSHTLAPIWVNPQHF